MQQFNYEEDQMGENWQITQTLAFNMSGEAFCTLTVRNKDGDVQNREYTLYLAAENWQHFVEYGADWVNVAIEKQKDQSVVS